MQCDTAHIGQVGIARKSIVRQLSADLQQQARAITVTDSLPGRSDFPQITPTQVLTVLDILMLGVDDLRQLSPLNLLLEHPHGDTLVKSAISQRCSTRAAIRGCQTSTVGQHADRDRFEVDAFCSASFLALKSSDHSLVVAKNILAYDSCHSRAPAWMPRNTQVPCVGLPRRFEPQEQIWRQLQPSHRAGSRHTEPHQFPLPIRQIFSGFWSGWVQNSIFTKNSSLSMTQALLNAYEGLSLKAAEISRSHMCPRIEHTAKIAAIEESHSYLQNTHLDYKILFCYGYSTDISLLVC